MNTSELQRIKQRYGIVGNDAKLNRALEIALKIAPVDLSVLITGENGVGKEIFPRIIHDHSRRKGRKYLAVNCGAIPEGTIDSELFGHEKGAFTGAVERREGYFAVANGGTLFLDEVGELPLQTQARLLRVLETGEFIPVGSSDVHRTDVRIVAATNVNMEKAIRERRFREDLYYRLNSVAIAIPPLRDRGEDVVLLFKKFALEMSEKYHMPPIRLDPASTQLLTQYAWPGNVRQLKNIAENMSVTSEQRDITPDQLALYLPNTSPTIAGDNREAGKPHSFEAEREIIYKMLFELRREVTELKALVGAAGYAKTVTPPAVLPAPGHGSMTVYDHNAAKAFAAPDARSRRPDIQEAEEVKDPGQPAPTPAEPADTASLDELERRSITEALLHNNSNRRLTAKQLGISERTLYRKIKEYGLE